MAKTKKNDPAHVSDDLSAPEKVVKRRSAGYGRKAALRDAQDVQAKPNQAHYGRTAFHGDRVMPVQKIVNLGGFPPAKPCTVKYISPEEVLWNRHNGLPSGLEGGDASTLGLPYREPRTSVDDWLINERHQTILASYYSAGVPITHLVLMLGINPMRFHMARQLFKPIWQAAKAAKASTVMDAVDGDNTELKAGKMQPDVARVRLQHNQFLAERLNSEEWAPRSKTELTGANGGAIQVEQVAVDKVMAKLLPR
jgi:hypothetical protein